MTNCSFVCKCGEERPTMNEFHKHVNACKKRVLEEARKVVHSPALHELNILKNWKMLKNVFQIGLFLLAAYAICIRPSHEVNF